MDKDFFDQAAQSFADNTLRECLRDAEIYFERLFVHLGQALQKADPGVEFNIICHVINDQDVTHGIGFYREGERLLTLIMRPAMGEFRILVGDERNGALIFRPDEPLVTLAFGMVCLPPSDVIKVFDWVFQSVNPAQKTSPSPRTPYLRLAVCNS